MRIGVITFCWSKDNYGQILQAYALQRQLKRMGHDAFVIDYEKRAGWMVRLKQYVKDILFLRIYKDKRHFNSFVRNNISLTTTKYKSIKKLRNNPPNADCYISGSDQIWAQLLYDENNYAYFLDFGGDVRRVAYAPSFAREAYPNELIGKLGNLLSNYDYLSVREPQGIDICKKAGISNVKCVLDPTLLLTSDDYNLLLKKRHWTTYTEEQIFYYLVNVRNMKEARWNEVIQFAKNHNYKLVAASSSGACPPVTFFPKSCFRDLTIKQWIETIARAKMIITSSFHGIVFCILYHKPFLFIPLTNEYSQSNERVFSLLKSLDLSERIIGTNERIAEKVSGSINWTGVESRLSTLRNNSIQYLYESTL